MPRSPLWTLRELFRAANVDAEVTDDVEVTGLAWEPDAVVRGDLFCCIPGEHADGHDFADAVSSAGAAALVVDRALAPALPQARVARVRDVLGPLADAFFGHPSREMPVAGVTGTNGKTTVTYLLESIAGTAGFRPGVIGTVNRRFAGKVEPAPRNTPEAIDFHRLLRRMRDAGVDLTVVEATSDGLAAGRLRATTFATAAFTNLTQDHLNTHGSMEAYFEAKSLLFDPSYTSHAVINVGDDHGRALAERASGLDVLTYGSRAADISCVSADFTSTGTTATLQTPTGRLSIETALVGPYNVDNCMCALGMALQLGIDVDQVTEGIRRLPRVPGRLERIEEGQPFSVLVDYAHTPDALDQALRASRELATGRVIVVFGCGGDRDRAKRPLMGEIATRIADLAIVTSDNPRSEDPERIVAEIAEGARRGRGLYRIVVDRREAIADALADAGAGDVVLIAGKGHEQGQQFADRTLPFDDRDVARELLKEVACRS